MYKKPNLLVIGAQKSGTTFLCKYLSENKNVIFSKPKEPMFFNKIINEQSEFKGYMDEYFDFQVIGSTDVKYVAEGSTTYFQSETAQSQVPEFLGHNLKVIICLRHPVEKAVSLLFHNHKKGRDISNIDIVQENKSTKLSAYSASYYAENLSYWINLVGKSNIHVKLFEELESDPLEFVNSTFSWLGLKSKANINTQKVNAGVSYYKKSDGIYLDEISTNEPVITSEQLELLKNMFVDDVCKLEKILELDLSLWKENPYLLA